MNKLLIVALVFMFNGSLTLAQDSPADRAQQANLLFENGDPGAAIEVYEALIADQIHDAAIYVNLGHAYFSQQNLGKALLNYRRAQRINPRDTQMNDQLARLRALRVDIQGDDATLIDSLTVLTSGILTLTELSWLALGLWLLFFVGLNVLIINSQWRTNFRGPLLVLLILTVSIFSLWASRAYSERFRPAAIVLPAMVTVRSGPDDSYLELYELHMAAEMRIVEERGNWIRFVLPDGRQGWIEDSAVESV